MSEPLRRRLAIAGFLVLGLTIALATSGALAPSSRQAFGSSTTLTIIGGLVDVRRASAPYAPAADGEILQAGDAVRTGPDGRAVLTYFEGSTVEIEPSSELAIDAVGIDPDASTLIVMTQLVGHTWHVVTRQLSATSKYEVNTPAATAAVRGTTFEVLVERDVDGEPVATVLTTEGTVGLRRVATATAPAEEVRVEAGREAAAKRGRAIEPPRQKREPERVVTMTIGSERTTVVDPLGRANGIRDGKVVLQTPGARVERVDGKLVVTLPDVPEGKLAAHVDRDPKDGEIAVETRVRERDLDEERSETRAVVPARGTAVVDVEVRRGERPDLRARIEARRASPSPIVATRPAGPSATRPSRSPVPAPTLRALRSFVPGRLADARMPSPRPSEGPRVRPTASASPRATTLPALRLPAIPTLSAATRAPEPTSPPPTHSLEPSSPPPTRAPELSSPPPATPTPVPSPTQSAVETTTTLAAPTATPTLAVSTLPPLPTLTSGR